MNGNVNSGEFSPDEPCPGAKNVVVFVFEVDLQKWVAVRN